MSADGGDLPAPELSKEERLELVRQVQHYFREEFDVDLGDLGAEFVIEFFGKLLGPPYYNRAVADARAIVADRAQTIDEELFGLTRELKWRGGPGRG
ncbi:MAG: DUF2164 domain-containing protein [Dehalococcoidia bacterium]